jgi:hypothetical protein
VTAIDLRSDTVPFGPRRLRAVTRRDVEQAAAVIERVLA